MSHALLSPSSAHRWLRCPASVNLEQHCENTSSAFADEGTVAHELAADMLSLGIGRGTYTVNGVEHPVTPEMIDYVSEYTDYVRSLGGTRFVEQSLDISEITTEVGAKGTADVVVLLDDELVVVDLKYGMGVRVDAEKNEQLSIYGYAAVCKYSLLSDFKKVRLVIVQPRLGHISEWVVSYDELVKTMGEMRETAIIAWNFSDPSARNVPAELYNAGEKQCRFCRAKAICDAAAKKVLETVANDFVDETQPLLPQLEHSDPKSTNLLAGRLALVDFIKKWCEAIETKAYAELHVGNQVTGYKLVEGRRGARAWKDTEGVEQTLKTMKVKQEDMYNRKLISPTDAEKLHKTGILSDRRWTKLQECVEQKTGKPVIAPESDKRPAIVVDIASDFTPEV